MSIVIERLNPGDWPEVVEIYRQGIETRMATFETEVPSWAAWNAGHLADCRLVARQGEAVLGWAALSPVSDRCVYGGVAEHSIYIAAVARGQGVGKILLTALVTASEQAGFWTLQSGIFPENIASSALHRACGFREIGYRERIGQLDGVWRDTILIERRSAVVGTDAGSQCS
ncbi:GNAT family N-acetyltransferase [Chloroflexota bacterium]